MVLFLNSVSRKCGVYQYGARVYKVLAESSKYRVRYAEVNTLDEYRRCYDKLAPDIVIYNYHYYTMPWLTQEVLRGKRGVAHVAFFHETKMIEGFDCHISVDPTQETACPSCGQGLWCSMGRPVPEYTNSFGVPAVPTIGSFGLGVSGKNYDLLCARVNAEFDHAIININIPTSRASATELAALYRAQITKRGIQLNVTYDFLDESDLLDFLARNTINVFLYPAGRSRGVSSATDYALAVRRPLAITKSNRFRHIWPRAQEICLENSTLPEIIERGLSPLAQFYAEWTKENLLRDIEAALGRAVVASGERKA